MWRKIRPILLTISTLAAIIQLPIWIFEGWSIIRIIIACVIIGILLYWIFWTLDKGEKE